MTYHATLHNCNPDESVAFVEPSITTFIGVNPGFCLSVIDGIRSNSTHVSQLIMKVKCFMWYSWQSMLDKECYYMNLTDANLHNKTNWQFEYSAKVGVRMGRS